MAIVKPHGLCASFRYAFAGLGRLVKERNFLIHLIISIFTVVAGMICRLSLTEWCVIILCFGMVLAAEGLNTAIEILADRVCQEKDESIGRVKDVAAAAVLLAAVSAAGAGLLIFLRKTTFILLAS